MTSISAPLFAQTRNAFLPTQGEIPDLPRSRISQATSATIPLAEIRVPPELGSLDSLHHGSSGRTYIYLKDAHTVPDAQKSLEALVEYFVAHYGIKRVYLEGAEGRLDPLIYQNFPDKKKLRRVFDQYLNRAEISGAATASVFSPLVDFQGMENWKTYQDNYAAYLNAVRSQVVWRTQIKSLEEMLLSEKKRIYSAKALSADQLLNLWNDSELKAESFFHVLASQVTPQELSSWPHLQALISQWKNENGPSLDAAILKIVPTLESSASEKSSVAWNEKLQAWKTGQISSEEFLDLLIKKIQSKDPRRADSLRNEFQGILEGQDSLSRLRGSEVRWEIENFLTQLEEKSIQTSGEKELAVLSKKIWVLHQLIEFKLEWKDWLFLKQSISAGFFSGGSRTAFKDRAQDFLQNFQKSSEGQSYFRFYDLASERSDIFIKTISQNGQRSPKSIAIVVTGGFHSEALLEELRNRGDSYLEISPGMKTLPKEDRTSDLMRGEVSWKKYLYPQNASVDLCQAFTQATVDELMNGLYHSNAFSGVRLWRDEILRALAKQGRLQESGRYTHFIDKTISRSISQESLQIKQGKLERFLAGVNILNQKNQLDALHLNQLVQSTATLNSPYSVAPFVSGLHLAFQPIKQSHAIGDRFSRAEVRSQSADGDEGDLWRQSAKNLREHFEKGFQVLAEQLMILDAALGATFPALKTQGSLVEQFDAMSKRLTSAQTPSTVNPDFVPLRLKLMPYLESLRRKYILYEAIAQRGVVPTALRGEIQDLSRSVKEVLEVYQAKMAGPLSDKNSGAKVVSWEELLDYTVPYQEEFRTRKDVKDRRIELEEVFHQVLRMYPSLNILGEKAAFQELQSWIDPEKSNLLDDTRIRLGVSPAIAFRGELMTCVLPPQEMPRGSPWRVIIIAGQNHVGHLAIEGDPKFSNLNIAEGPLNVFIKDSMADYESGIYNELPQIPGIAEATDDNRHGASSLHGAQLSVLASQGNSKKELIEDTVMSLVFASILGENLVLSSGANLDTQSMNWAWNAAMNAAIDKKYRWAGKTAGSWMVSKVYWAFFRVWKWLYFHSLFIRKGPVIFSIPPVVGVSKYLRGIAKAELLVDGTSVVAAMLTAIRHPYIRDHYFLPRQPEDPRGFRVAFFGAGRVAAQCVEVLSRKSLLPTGGESRSSFAVASTLQQEQIRVIGLRNQQTEIVQYDGLDLDLLREFQLHVAAGEKNTLAGLAAKYKGQRRKVNEYPAHHLARGESYAYADLLVLADAPGSFTEEHAKLFRGKMVLEGLYQVATPEAVKWMRDHDVLFLRMSSVNVGSAKAAYHEILNHQFPYYEYGRDYQVLDSIASYVTANLWQEFSRFEQVHGSSHTFSGQIHEANQWFTAEANDVTEALASKQSLGKYEESQEGIGIRLAQVACKIAHYQKLGISFPMALSLAIYGQLLSEDVSGIQWQKENEASIREKMTQKVAQLLEELSLDDSKPENRQRRRNAAYVLGKINLSDDMKGKASMVLSHALIHDPYYQVRAEAAKAIGRIGYAGKKSEKDAEWIRGISGVPHEVGVFSGPWWKEISRVAGYCALLRAIGDPRGTDPKVQQWVEWAIQRFRKNIPWGIFIELAEHELSNAQEEVAEVERRVAGLPREQLSVRGRELQLPLKRLADAHYRLAAWLSMKSRCLSVDETERARGDASHGAEIHEADSAAAHHLQMAAERYAESQKGGHYYPLVIQLQLAETLIRMQRREKGKQLLLELLIPTSLQAIFKRGQEHDSGAESVEIYPQYYQSQMIAALEKLLILDGFEQEVAAKHAHTLGDYLMERETFLHAVVKLSRADRLGQAIEMMAKEESQEVRAEMGSILSAQDKSWEPYAVEVLRGETQTDRLQILKAMQAQNEYVKKSSEFLEEDYEASILQDFRDRHHKKLISDNRILTVDLAYQLLILLASGFYSDQPSLENGLEQLFLGHMKLKHITLQLPQDTRRIRQIIKKLGQENLRKENVKDPAGNSQKISRSELRILSAVLGRGVSGAFIWDAWIKEFRQNPEKTSGRLRAALPLFEAAENRFDFQGPFEGLDKFRSLHPDYDTHRSLKLSRALANLQKLAKAVEDKKTESLDYSLVVRWNGSRELQSELLQFVGMLKELQSHGLKMAGQVGIVLESSKEIEGPTMASLRSSGVVEIWHTNDPKFARSVNHFLDRHRNAFFLSEWSEDEKLIRSRPQLLLSQGITLEEAFVYFLHDLLPETSGWGELNLKTLQTLEQGHAEFMNLQRGYLILGAALRDWILNVRTAEHISTMA